MSELLEWIRRYADAEKGIFPEGEAIAPYEHDEDIAYFLTMEADEKIVAAAIADPEEAWNVFRNGTDEEFVVLVNSMGEIGKEFESDDAHREIMRLAKARNSELVIEETRAGFGLSFERFWNEGA